ncbi:MAG TPA: CocE/NonD family hydrolase, partial [Thermoanaerobaculia bacterium]|nr:CocE/NonD family hydrolase [Thermoanaerobaculia bacterium]
MRHLVSALFAASAALCAQAPPAGPPPRVAAYDLTWDARIPLRDGARLHALLYRPRVDDPGPVLLWMTPYIADNFHAEAAYLAGRGFAVALVDVRGRGGSDGTFEPWLHDGRDGFDAVEWLARQPWSNGKVGMIGHSYGGRAVWSTIKENPPHLAAAAPISASYPMYGWHDILTPDTLQWVALTGSAAGNVHVLADSAFWVAKLRELYLSKRPLRDFDRIVGSPSALFQRFLDHPTLDAFWTAPAPTPADFARIDLPILTVTAESESNNVGPLWYYRQHEKYASAAAFSRHRLLIGPWDHHGTLRPAREAGGVPFGPAAELDMKKLLADWFDFALGTAPLPPLLADPVRYYALGAEEWRGASRLEPSTPVAAAGASGHPPEAQALYLESGAEGARSLSRPGRLSAMPPTGNASDSWTGDPLDLRPGQAETAEVEDWAARFDTPDDLWGAGLVYATEPFREPTELSGFPRIALWIALDVPDTNIAARLDLITPEGGTILIGEDWIRARYRTSLERAEKIPPGVPLEYGFELPFVVRVLPPGSRLRLILRSPNSIFLEKNWNGGGVVAEESGRDARTAHVTVF